MVADVLIRIGNQDTEYDTPSKDIHAFSWRCGFTPDSYKSTLIFAFQLVIQGLLSIAPSLRIVMAQGLRYRMRQNRGALGIVVPLRFLALAEKERRGAWILTWRDTADDGIYRWHRNRSNDECYLAFAEGRNT